MEKHCPPSGLSTLKLKALHPVPLVAQRWGNTNIAPTAWAGSRLKATLRRSIVGLGCLGAVSCSAPAWAALPHGTNVTVLPLVLRSVTSSDVNLSPLPPVLPKPTNAQTETDDEADEPQPIPVTTSNAATSNAPLAHCSEVATRRYAILVNQPIDSLPQLPEFLTIAATPCQYFGILMTFFGTFDSAESVTLRADQLRQLKLDAVVHSFKGDISSLNRNYRAYSVIVEMGANPDTTVQQLQSLRFSPQKVNLGNRAVLVVSPSSSLAPARAVSNNLRARGLTTQVISATLLNRNLRPAADPNRTTVAQGNSTNTAAGNTPRPPRPGNTGNSTGTNPGNGANNNSNPKPSGTKPNPKGAQTANNGATLPPIPALPQGKVYRLLIPVRGAETLAQARAIASDAFPRTIQGKKLIQVRSYTDRDNVTRERNRFNERFPGTIVIIE